MILLVDSITEAIGCAEGCFVVSGSHGGLSSGRFALQATAALVAFNDAGVGKDGAGIAALALLEKLAGPPAPSRMPALASVWPRRAWPMG